MGIINFLFLKIHTEDFDKVVVKPTLMKKLRHLTLHAGSGLNFELNHLVESSKTRKVNAKVILAYYKRELIAWGLLSREKSKYNFRSHKGFNPVQGVLFEVYVSPAHRRRGIGSAILKAARKKAGSMRLCIAPWDDQSRKFFKTFNHYKNVKM